MNVFGRNAAARPHLIQIIGRKLIQRKFASGTLISRDSPEKRSAVDLPDNIVVLGVDTEQIQKRKRQSFLPVPDDCEIVRTPKDCPRHRDPPRAWLDSFKSIDFVPNVGVELHPEVFACNPRMDFLHQCKQWQENFKEVDYSWKPTRAEVGFGRKKPYPQKGTGKARHGSTNAPQFVRGGIAHGPRGPKALFQKIHPHVRLGALTSALTIKFHQENLSIVDNFDLSLPEKDHLREVLEARSMAESSVLMLYSDKDNLDESANIFAAVEDWREVNLMPLVAMNMWSVLHHDWLVLTRQALDELEVKITWNLHRYDWIDKPHNFYRDLPFEVEQVMDDSER